MRGLLCALLVASAAWAQAGLTAKPDSSVSLTAPSNDAYISAASGKVSIDRDAQAWALSTGETLPTQRMLSTGSDGYVRLEMGGGASVEVYANSRVIFRHNIGSAGDLLDVLSGRVRVHFSPHPGELQERVLTRIASITAHEAATVALATDEDNNIRIDVLEGEVAVQHMLHPRTEPTIVKAIDAIVVQQNEQISRQVDRGTLYRYTVKPLHNLIEAMTLGHSRPQVQEQPFEGEPIFARVLPFPFEP